MKLTTRGLLVVSAVIAVMLATLRVPSERSVLVLLICVCAILVSTARACIRSTDQSRVLFGAAAVAGVVYLIFYVATDSWIEIWINKQAMVPFVLINGGPEMSILDGVDWSDLSSTNEFQYFRQMMNLVFVVVFAFITGSLAACLIPP